MTEKPLNGLPLKSTGGLRHSFFHISYQGLSSPALIISFPKFNLPVSFAGPFCSFPKISSLISAVKVTQGVLNDRSLCCTEWGGKDPESPEIQPVKQRHNHSQDTLVLHATGNYVDSAYRDRQC